MLLGYDIGSSAIKGSLVDAVTGQQVAFARSPSGELDIDSPEQGWAEQHPELWWEHLKNVTQMLLDQAGVEPQKIRAIGISYQMHGLVLVDEQQQVLRPAIIWCDGRAVSIGKSAFNELGNEYCLKHLLNSPGNFTASKLKWVMNNEPEIFKKIHKMLLPGDFIAMRLSGEISTTVSGLSEAVLWDYDDQSLSEKLLDYYGIPECLLPEVHVSFDTPAELSEEAAGEVGLSAGTPLSYRAGDQPNNALSLNVMEPGEAAATAGTSGVIYGVTDEPLSDDRSRVNTFVHVNHKKDKHRYGVLLCINGTGIQNSWLRRHLLNRSVDYSGMNRLAEDIAPGAEGVLIIPFGNGPERILEDQDVGAHISGINFNRHDSAHIIRAAHEGVAFALSFGFEMIDAMGLKINTIRAGTSNMFQSPVFCEALCNTTGLEIELYDTNGAQGAAIGAGIGAGCFENREDAFQGLRKSATLQPVEEKQRQYANIFSSWKSQLTDLMST